MHPLTQRLHQEHKHIAKLMICLRHQLARFEQPDVEPDLTLVIDILDYVTHYPEQWHHPFEDLIFKAVQDKGIQSEALEALLVQHHELAQLTQTIMQYFNQIQMGSVVPMEEVLKKTSEYIELQLKHLSFEENTAFPVAEDNLSEQDWLALEQQASHVDDPVFGACTEQRYRHIYQSVIEQQYPY